MSSEGDHTHSEDDPKDESAPTQSGDDWATKFLFSTRDPVHGEPVASGADDEPLPLIPEPPRTPDRARPPVATPEAEGPPHLGPERPGTPEVTPRPPGLGRVAAVAAALVAGAAAGSGFGYVRWATPLAAASRTAEVARREAVGLKGQVDSAEKRRADALALAEAEAKKREAAETTRDQEKSLAQKAAEEVEALKLARARQAQAFARVAAGSLALSLGHDDAAGWSAWSSRPRGDGDAEVVKAHYVKAAEALTDALGSVPDDGAVLGLRALARFASGGDAADIRADLDGAVKASNGDATVVRAAHRLLEDLGYHDDAERLGYSDAAGSPAAEYVGKRVARARRLLDQAARARADVNADKAPQARAALEGALKSATEAADRAAEAKLDDAWAPRLLRGRALEALGRYGEAIADYDTAEKLATDDKARARILTARARTRTARARKQADGKAGEQGRREPPAGALPVSAGPRGLLAATALGALPPGPPPLLPPDVATAADELRRAIKLSGGAEPEPLFTLGSLLLENGDPHGAFAYLLRAYLVRRPDSSSSDGVNESLLRDRLRQAAATLPDDPDKLREFLAQALSPGGEPVRLKKAEDLVKVLQKELADERTRGLKLAGELTLAKAEIVELKKPQTGPKPPHPDDPNPRIAGLERRVAELTRDLAKYMRPVPQSDSPPPPAVPAGAGHGVDPGLAVRYHNQGLGEFFAGATDRAAESFGYAIVLYPNYPLSHYFRGLSLSRLGREAEAEAEWREGAIRERDDNSLARTVPRGLERIQGEERHRLDRFRH